MSIVSPQIRCHCLLSRPRYNTPICAPVCQTDTSDTLVTYAKSCLELHRPTAMRRRQLLAAFLAAASRVAAHPLCYDDTSPNPDKVMDFCPEQQAGACCSDLDEALFEAKFQQEAANITEACGVYLREVSRPRVVCILREDSRQRVRSGERQRSPHTRFFFETQQATTRGVSLLLGAKSESSDRRATGSHRTSEPSELLPTPGAREKL